MKNYHRRFLLNLSITVALFLFIESSSAEMVAKEYWGNTFFENKKIGYFNYNLNRSKDKKGYELNIISYRYPTEDAQKLKETHELSVIINDDLTLNRMSIKNYRKEGEIDAEARVYNQKILIDVTRNNYVTHDEIPIKTEVYPSSILMELVADRNLEAGTYEFTIFDEEFLDVMRAKVNVIRRFEMPIGSKRKKFFEVIVAYEIFENLNQRLVIDEDGKLIVAQYEDINLLFKTVPESEIEEDKILPKPQRRSILTDTYILDSKKLSYLKVKGHSLMSIRNNLFFKTQEQKVKFLNNNYDVIIEVDRNIPKKKFKISSEGLKRYLDDSIYIQTNDKEIQALAANIIGDDNDTISRVTKISKWIRSNIKIAENSVFYSARDVLKIKQGDCTEYAMLFGALCRSLGIPTKGVFGISYAYGYFGYHMWNEIYYDGVWLPTDVTVNQVGFVDAGHIKFFETDLSFKSLAISNYRMVGSERLNKFEVLNYKGTKGMAFREMAILPNPNLQSYPEAVLPMISAEDIVIEDPIRIGVTYFDVSDLPEEYRSISIGLQRILKRNLFCIRKFSVLNYKDKPAETNCFLKTDKELFEICDKKGLDYLLIGKITKGKDRNADFIIRSSIYDKNKNMVTILEEIKCKKNDFLKSGQRVIFEVTEKLGMSISDVEQERIEKFYLTNFDTFLLYSKGTYEIENFLEESEESYIFFIEGPIYLMVALMEDPNWSLAYKGLANHYSDDDFERASYFYDTALRLDPFNAECYWDKYMALIESGKEDKEIYDEAKILLERSLNVTPYFAMAHLSLGSRYSRNDEYDKALNETLKAQVLSPKHATVYYNLGVIYRDKEMFEEAAYNAKKALELDREIDRAHYLLGQIYKKQGKIDDAIEEYKLEESINPKYHYTYERLGFLFSQDKKDYKQGIHYYKKAIELGSTFGCVYNNLAWSSIIENSDIDKTIDWAKKGVELNTEKHNHLGTLAWAYYKNRRYDEAIETFESIEKNLFEATDALGMTVSYLRKGDREKALEMLKKAFEMDKKLNEETIFKQEESFIVSNLGIKIDEIMPKPSEDSSQ